MIIQLKKNQFEHRYNQFINLPQKMNYKVYDKARLNLKKYLSGFKCIESVYEFGSVLAPGFSDLDIIVVLKDNINCDTLNDLNSISIPRPVKDLMHENGSYIFMNCNHIQKIYMWDDVSLKLLFGKRQQIDSLPSNYISPVEICRVLDWLPERTARLSNIVKDLFEKKKIDVVDSANLLYSACNTFKRLDKVFAIGSETSREIIINSELIRNQWFENDLSFNINFLFENINNAIIESYHLMDKFSKKLLQGKWYQGCTKPDGNYSFHFPGNFKYVYRSGSEYIQSFKRVKQKTFHETTEIFVPFVWLCHLWNYSVCSGYISQQLRNAFHIETPLTDMMVPEHTLLEVMHKRIELCNNNANFLKRCKIKNGLFKFGWFFP